jgi:NitT/TauT family transport system substrate-binding protein
LAWGGEKSFYVVLVSLSLVIVRSAAAANAPGQLTTISIAYTSISPQYSPIWIAKDAGIFRKNGINAELVYMRGGVLATQALVSGDVQFINAGGGGVVDAVLGGADIFIIASPINQEPQVLVTRRDIKEAAQLKGKKIAVNSLAGPSILSLKMILAALGLDPDKDVGFLATGPSASRFARSLQEWSMPPHSLPRSLWRREKPGTIFSITFRG